MTAHRTGRRSLRRRLLGGMLVWVVLSLALTGLVLQGLFRHHAETQFHADLQRELDRLTAGFELPPGGNRRSVRPARTRAGGSLIPVFTGRSIHRTARSLCGRVPCGIRLCACPAIPWATAKCMFTG